MLSSFHPAPSKIKITTMLDGGTTTLTLTNPNGKTYSICLDQQAIEYVIETELSDEQWKKISKEIKQKVYLGVTHPQEGGVALPFKGTKESELAEIMRSWRLKDPKPIEDIEYFLNLLAKPRLRKIEIPNQTSLTTPEAAPPSS